MTNTHGRTALKEPQEYFEIGENQYHFMAMEDTKMLFRKMKGMKTGEMKDLLKSIVEELKEHPITGYLFKLLIEKADSKKNLEMSTAIKEVAKKLEIKILRLEDISK